MNTVSHILHNKSDRFGTNLKGAGYRSLIWRVLSRIVLLLMTCTLLGQSKPARATLSTPPSIEITAPLDDAEFFLGDDVFITASATDADGSVALVEFFADEVKIGEDTSPPFEWLWSQPAMGSWDLVAMATDNDGDRDSSEKVDITVSYPEFEYTLSFSDETPFHSNAFNLIISTELAGASIWYTLDGSHPISGNYTLIESAPLQIDIDPEDISSGRGRTPGVVLRAVVMRNGVQQSRIATRTYLFIDAVRSQQYPGGGWPNQNINGQILEYAVDQGVANDPIYRELIDDALLDIPSISLVTDLDNLFDSQSGIYVNAQYHGIEWERPVSVELLNPDGSPGFQIDGGLRIRGGWSRHGEFRKHSLRLFFREEYGAEQLEFPLFGAEGVDVFSKVDLRTSQNYAWSTGYVYENTMNRDVFSRDIQARMGQPYTRSRYYHLYLNGLYWGLFQTQERSEANWAESYLGGDEDDYDVVKVDIGEDWNLYEIEATDGNLEAWHDVWDACQTGFGSLVNYHALEGRLPNGLPDPSGRKLVDIDNLIDYMLIIFYTGNIDAPVSKFRGEASPNNFYAIYDRTANNGFIFLVHDSEHTLLVEPIGPSLGLNEDRVNINPWVNRFEVFHPQWLHMRLAANLEYRLRFADRVYRHFFNDGVLSPDSLTAIFNASAADIELAIIGESLRWGDLQRSKYNAWVPAIDHIVNDYFPFRGSIVMDQFREAGLYPDLDPPLYRRDGQVMVESLVEIQGQTLIEIVRPEQAVGLIYYTLDGSDPRAFGGPVSSTAISGGSGSSIILDATTLIRSRILSQGNWSALHEIRLYNTQNLDPLLISEIHYHPLDEGEVSGQLYEFLEFHNPGAFPLDLSLLTFSNGIDYSFPAQTYLDAGAYLVLASHSPSFEARYNFTPFGEFTGQLDNGGERLVLQTVSGDTVISIRYDDHAPWPEAADGDGPSLVWTDANQTGDINDGSNWAASSVIHGSPGTADPAAVVTGVGQQPLVFSLSQNFPNPFNPFTTIRYGLEGSAETSLLIYDLRGRLVRTLEIGLKTAGWYEVRWDGLNDAAVPLPTGIYLARLKSGSATRTIKMHLLK